MTSQPTIYLVDDDVSVLRSLSRLLRAAALRAGEYMLVKASIAWILRRTPKFGPGVKLGLWWSGAGLEPNLNHTK